VSAHVLALFAKAPVPSQAKTRLCPPLTPERAADLYRAMLLDVLDQHAGEEGIERVVWYTPPASFDWFRTEVPAVYRLLPQCGADLGARMARAFQVHCWEGYERIVLRGTDSPTLPEEAIERAFAALERVDLVLCPDLDGGYNLVGLREPCAPLFQIEMSRSSVLAQTLNRAHSAGLSVELLPAHHDVDTVADLERLAPELDEARTPRTLRWLRGTF
jgi:rSAM/selenodomain-associated transferase 1